MIDVNYKYVTEKITEKLIADRREFHQYPEEGWTEFKTCKEIADRLKKIGYAVKVGKEVCDDKARLGKPDIKTMQDCENRAIEEGVSPEYMEQMKGGCTGVIGIMKGELPGNTTAFRFDIDALPIEEKNKTAYTSLHKGVMHACGHDGHIAVGLAVAKLIAEHRNNLKGEIRLIFQPAEEGCRGAAAIVTKGWLQNVHTFISGHIGLNSRKIGEIVVCDDGFFATTKMDFVFYGETAHAGKNPEAGRNALLAASAFTVAVYGISRVSFGDTRINVGKFISGNGRNIVSDKAYLQLETRGTTTEANDYMKTQVLQTAEGICKIYGVTFDYQIVGNVGSAKSDHEIVKHVSEYVTDMGLGNLFKPKGYMGASEDAVAMMQAVQDNGGKAAYFLFGTELNAEHHQSKFDFNEAVLPIMTEFFARAALDLGEDK